ncbi:MAG TPA: nodulation protein NfeD [Nitrospiria bacterium]|jgi:membrane-bound serine protease (ClpP class)
MAKLNPTQLGKGGLFIFFIIFPFAIPAQAEEKKVHVISYNGVINPVAAEYISKAISTAEEDRAEALVIQLDTPGGLDQSMRIIIKEMNASSVPVLVYVSPTGARAASAGVFITMAAHVAAMAPGTNIGAAHPVALGGGEMDSEMVKKVENDAAAYIKSIAQKHHRNEEWAEKAVRESVSVTEEEALKLNVIDLIAENLTSVLDNIEGREVSTSAGPQTLHTKGKDLKTFEMGTRFKILQALSDPNIAFLLMSLGMIGLFFELSNPGLILPGVVGAISLILAFYSFQTLPINYAGLLLMIFGLILFIAEIKIISYGLLSVGGVISMVLGSIMLVDSDVPFLKISLSVIIPVVLSMALFFAIAIQLALKAHKRKPVSGKEALIGLTGLADTKIFEDGKVSIHGELWDAVSQTPIPKGEEVEVLQVNGLRLQVKKRI